MSVITAIGVVILAVIIFSLAKSAFADVEKYKFLFRDTIYSHKPDVYPSRKADYELAPVMRGRLYRPNYFFLPDRKQYLVRSSIEFPDLMNFDTGGREAAQSTKRYVLLDDAGQLLRRFDTNINFSRFSGKFFSPTHYIDWLDSGLSVPIAYERIFNQDLAMDQKSFVKKFRDLYARAEYSENVNLRVSGDELHQAAVVFKIQGRWSILLSGLRHSHMSNKYNDEDLRTAIWDQIYNVNFDYYDPESKQEDPYPASPPSLKLVPLETETGNPYLHKNIIGMGDIVVDKYSTDYSTGWNGIMELKGVPIYIPGESYGIAYVQLKLHKNRFYFKVPNVEKFPVLPLYNLGIRIFKLPKTLGEESSLVFMESTQNGGVGNVDRAGGGVYVVRERLGENFPVVNDLPPGISEKRYAQLPISLQQALLDIEHTTDLVIDDGTMSRWLPEIELLKNLTYLKIQAGLKELPDGIAALKKLRILNLSSNHYLQKISPKISELKELQSFDASVNKLTYFPAGLTALPKLKTLNLGMNEFTEIPPDIARLKNLQIMELDWVNVSSLPDSMADMKQLYISVGNDSDFSKRFPEKFQHLFIHKEKDELPD